MPRLADVLWTPAKREPLVADCAELIEAHVASRRGLKGLGLKTGFALLKSLKPDALSRALHALLPEFAAALDPLYQQFRGGAARADFSAFLQARADDAVAALLSVTDARVQRSPNAALKSLYVRLRTGADEELHAVLPKLAEVLADYLG